MRRRKCFHHFVGHLSDFHTFRKREWNIQHPLHLRLKVAGVLNENVSMQPPVYQFRLRMIEYIVSLNLSSSILAIVAYHLPKLARLAMVIVAS